MEKFAEIPEHYIETHMNDLAIFYPFINSNPCVNDFSRYTGHCAYTMFMSVWGRSNRAGSNRN